MLTCNRGLDALKESSGSLDAIADVRGGYACCPWRYLRRVNNWQVHP